MLTKVIKVLMIILMRSHLKVPMTIVNSFMM